MLSAGNGLEFVVYFKHGSGHLRRMGHRALLGLFAGRDGTTAVEYAVIVALVLLVCISTINALGQCITQPLKATSQQVSGAQGGVKVNKSQTEKPGRKKTQPLVPRR